MPFGDRSSGELAPYIRKPGGEDVVHPRANSIPIGVEGTLDAIGDQPDGTRFLLARLVRVCLQHAESC